jgi:hypothetical protein
VAFVQWWWQTSNSAAGTGVYLAGYSAASYDRRWIHQREEAQEAEAPGSIGPGGPDTMGSFAKWWYRRVV